MDKPGYRQTLTPEEFQRMRQMFESALNVPPEKRREFLEASGGDFRLIEEVLRMLVADGRSTGPFDRASSNPGPAQISSQVCSSCRAAVGETDRFCRSCGTPTDDNSIGHEGRFRAGTLFAQRFRIVALLGRGGMGDVYRAHDLELDQPVALKFLTGFRVDDRARARLRNEVRLARTISHPNVCRVFDIGESGGELYLSMEYVDGEDLAALLKRIGRLPPDKGVEIARKLCAGLAAAHAKGVLHRDFKPTNIMIDSHGEVRIMDFGVATLDGRSNRGDILTGTPAYMAPEQLAGREPTKQSDLYALGLVLYELFTGKRPVEADSLDEIARARARTPLTTPSKLIPDLNSRIELVILRCLNPDPAMRPRSALEVAAALPGGDPLAEALAAGETPSPDMVAAAGSTEGLAPRTAVALLVGIAVGLAALCVLTPKTQAISKLPFEYSPEVLTEKARDIIRTLGYAERPVDSVSGFRPEEGYLEYTRLKDLPSRERPVDRWNRLLAAPPSPISFWYRQSSSPLVVLDSPALGRLAPADPWPMTPGLISVDTGLDGRLLRFAAVPIEMSRRLAEHGTDWSPLFAAAGLNVARFSPVDSQTTLPLGADAYEAWTGVYPRLDVPVRIETAASQGRPIYFEIVFPWANSQRFFAAASADQQPYAAFVSRPPRAVALLGLFLIVAVGLAARYNLKIGRGDGRGASRIGLAVSSAFLGFVILGAHNEIDTIFYSAAIPAAVFEGLLFAGFYLGLEPWVRRSWPQAVITWSRFLAGRWRDPVVGRDVLIGLLVVVLAGFGTRVVHLAIIQFGGAPAGPIPFFGDIGFVLDNLMGWRAIASTLLVAFFHGMTLSLAAFFILSLGRAIFRKPWIAATAFVLFAGALSPAAYFARGDSTNALIGLALFIVAVPVMLRFGLLAMAVWVCFGRVVEHSLLTTDLSAWYGQSTLAAVIVVSGVALWAFRVAIGGWTPLRVVLRGVATVDRLRERDVPPSVSAGSA